MNDHTNLIHHQFPHLRSVLKPTSMGKVWYSTDRRIDSLIITGIYYDPGRIEWALYLGDLPKHSRKVITTFNPHVDCEMFDSMLILRDGRLNSSPEHQVILITDYDLNPLVFETDFRAVQRALMSTHIKN